MFLLLVSDSRGGEEGGGEKEVSNTFLRVQFSSLEIRRGGKKRLDEKKEDELETKNELRDPSLLLFPLKEMRRDKKKF